MTVPEVLARVDAIKERAYDDESAHGMEDDLRRDVLLAIAARKTDDPQGIAAAALLTGAIEFSRWCA